MKRFEKYILFILLVSFFSQAYSQTISFGDSQDTFITSNGKSWYIYYYKPANYDSINSPILWVIHGSGGNGSNERNMLKDMADNREALIVSLTYAYSDGYFAAVSITNSETWLPTLFKEIYRYIINRENRDTMWVHIIGFSAGGQCVTRYMLLRQAIPDSIPIRMAVSISPFFYTFCTDSLNGDPMVYPCGLLSGNLGALIFFSLDFDVNFICNDHVKMYYNENYGVLIGTTDNIPNGGDCTFIQGGHRYERAQNFYAFSDTDAVARATTLLWEYAEVPGVGHNAYDLYYTKADTTDTSSIAETLLFDTPYHATLELQPFADFNIDTVFCNSDSITLTVSCINGYTNYYWNFGDATTATGVEVSHVYNDTGTYQINLIATNLLGTDSITYYYTYQYPVPISDFSLNDTLLSCAPFNVTFINGSKCADTYYWDFGDGITSTLSNPVHEYLSEGTYSVTLIVTNIYGADTLILNNYITIDSLKADFVADTTMVYLPNAMVNFTNQSIGASVYYWEFGDDSFITSTEKNPTYTYNQAGTYTVTLFVFDNEGCGDTLIIPNYIIVIDPTGIVDKNLEQFVDVKVYPNPFSQTTTFYFTIPETGYVRLELFNNIGQKVVTLFNNYAETQKEYSVQFNSQNLPEGIYLGMLQTSTERQIIKIVILK